MTFKAGESGNPTGRPHGSGHRQKLFNLLVEPHKNELVQTAINLALAGNEPMLRLFLERMLPARPNDDAISFNLPIGDIKKTDALLVCGENVLKAVANCDITPEQAKTLMSAMEMQRKQIETYELDERLSAIERTLNHKKEGIKNAAIKR